MSTRDEAARCLIDIENYLFRNDHMRQARYRVTDFTAHVPGLTPEQKARIARWYLDEQTYVARAVSEHIAERLNAGATAARARARTRAPGAHDDPHHDQPRRQRRGGLLTMLMITLTLAFAGAVLLTGPG